MRSTFGPISTTSLLAVSCSCLRGRSTAATILDRPVKSLAGSRPQEAHPMKLSTQLSYAGSIKEGVDGLVALEKAGMDIVWIAEAYGVDAVSVMGYVAARTSTIQIGAGILPIYSRTPALLAQTAAGVDLVSDGRCILGLGASGPRVIEGWHGVPYDRPLGRTEEIIDVCRKVWRREVLTHDGPSYTIPLPAGQGTGLGKALKMIVH